MPQQIVIACSVRPDNSGNANASDMAALLACQQLFSKPVRLGKDMDTIRIVVRKVPQVANVGDASAVQSARADVLASGVRAELAGVGLLYIPGAPVAPRTQKTDNHGMKPASKFKQTEAISRDAFESALIEAALTIGIPVLAVCAGSWRLLEAFGGGVRELSGDDVARHYERGWNCNHGLVVNKEGKGLLYQSARDSGGGPEMLGANSTHWAVADTQPSGALAKHGTPGTLASKRIPAPIQPEPRPANLHKKQNAYRRWPVQEAKRAADATAQNLADFAATPGRDFRNPGALLQVMVREGTQKAMGTVEGFESRSGAPVIGVQWHPESFLPGMKGHDEVYKTDQMVKFSQNIFMNMVLAAVASQTRRTDVIPALKQAFETNSMGLRHVGDDEKNYRPDRYAPGDVA